MHTDRYVTSSGSVVTGQRRHVERVREVDRMQLAGREAWIAALRAQGVKAAHPDDGWVDRDVDRVHLCYPLFNDELEVGDLLCLGSPEEHRIVRVTRVEDGWFLGRSWYWYFEPVAA